MEQAVDRGPRRAGARWTHPAIVGALLFLTVLAGYLLSYNVDKPTHNADWYIRYQVACSIVERNAFYIHPYDTSQRSGPGLGGHIYAQYTLGQTVAMVPLYMLGRVLAGVAHTNCDARVANTIVFLTCKSLDLILGALLAALFYATARLLRYTRRIALALSLLFAFGTSLWPDALSSEEHTMESLFLLAAAYAALRYTQSKVESRKSKEGRLVGRLWLVAMGLAAGLVFVTRVAGLIAIPIFALYLVALHARGEGRRATGESGLSGGGRRATGDSGAIGSPSLRAIMPRRRSTPTGRGLSFALRPSPSALRPLARALALYALGVLPSLVVNAAYDAVRFGKPWQTGPYADHSLGFPPWLGVPDLLVSPGKGLLWYTPALLLLVLAARPFWRRLRLPAILFALICAVYLLFYSDVNYWHGDPAWGPRYLYALLPYLILPLGEIFTRWRTYRLPIRGLVVGVLAASFLVQFSATTVSYWRHWQYIYAYHYDQVEDHGWGSNLNYWWKPEQSPIVISLEGIADITQKYVDHAPLLEHAARFRLSDPRESSIYQVYGQAAISLTDLDKLRDVANWNTFTVWWAHVYPWWPLKTVVSLALALAAFFLACGALLVALVIRADRPSPAPRALTAPGYGPPPGPYTSTSPNGRNGHGSGDAAGVLLADMVVSDERARRPVPAAPVGIGAAEQGARALTERMASRAAPAYRTSPERPKAGLLPIALGACAGALIYGGIAYGAASRAPRTAPLLIHRTAIGATVRDGDWAYRVLGVTSVPALPGGIDMPVDAAHHYVLVRLRVYNHLSRSRVLWPDSFDLTDSAGLRYQFVSGANTAVAELYHEAPAGHSIPARGALDEELIYQVRNATPTNDLALLGPGITLTRLHE